MSDYYPPAEQALPLFRRTDPPTSQAAAARVPSFRGAHHQASLAALLAGPAGQSELAARTGLTVAQVSKRLGELRNDGLIERDGECRSASGGREARYRRTA